MSLIGVITLHQPEFQSSLRAGDKDDAVTGRILYEAFSTVVILNQQCRTVDKVWLDVLRNIRQGTCTNKHLDIIRSLILAPGDQTGPDSPC
jgi:hypothetical protein